MLYITNAMRKKIKQEVLSWELPFEQRLNRKEQVVRRFEGRVFQISFQYFSETGLRKVK